MFTYHLKQAIKKKNLLVKRGKRAATKRMSVMCHSRIMEEYKQNIQLQSRSASPRASIAGTQSIQADTDIATSNREPMVSTMADMLNLALVTSPDEFLRDENELGHHEATDELTPLPGSSGGTTYTTASTRGGNINSTTTPLTEGETSRKGGQHIQLVRSAQTSQNSSKTETGTSDGGGANDENVEIEENPFGEVVNNKGGIGGDSDHFRSQTDFIEWALSGLDDSCEDTATIGNGNIDGNVDAPDVDAEIDDISAVQEIPDEPDEPDEPDITETTLTKPLELNQWKVVF